MTLRCSEIQELDRLEDDFQAAACDARFSPERRLSLLNNILVHMIGLVEYSYKSGQAQSVDLAEFVQDFISRRDLAAKWVEVAFSQNSMPERNKMMATLSFSALKIAMFERPVETYNLDR